MTNATLSWPQPARAAAGALLAALVAGLLAGCAGNPAAGGGRPPEAAPAEARDNRDGAAPSATSNQAPSVAFEKQQLERAAQAQRQGRLAEAALAYEVLTVLRPDQRDYRDKLADTRRQIDAAVAERLPRAVAAQKRGELDAAAQQFLGVLALAPDNDAAADGLRAVERERNKRNYLGKYSRITLTRRAMAEAEVQGPGQTALAPGSGTPGTLAERNELEHASMLASQGEYDDAIAMLEKRLAQDRRDDATRLMLADLYFQKGDRIAAKDRAGAITALERSLKLDAGNARVAARLKQLKATANTTAPAPAGADGSMTAPVTRGAAPAKPAPKAATPAAAAASGTTR